MPAFLIGLLSLARVEGHEPVERRACIAAPVIEDGAVVEKVCLEDAEALGLTMVDLSDGWVPMVLVDTPYRATWVGLANGRFDVVGAGPRAGDDAAFEPWGIHPSLSVLRARLEDEVRHACHAAIDDAALATTPVRVPSSTKALRLEDEEGAAAVVRAHLACDGLASLEVFHRREGLVGAPVSAGVLDEETRARLALPSAERDFLALLRALRERVVDAAGILEDGTATGAQGLVIGRLLDPPSQRPRLTEPSPAGAPDVVSAATDAAARALGLTDVDGARRALARLPWQGLVALRLPAAPPWHAPHMELRASISRGEVSASGLPLRGGERPRFTLLAGEAASERVLVAWPTTTGGMQREKVAGGVVDRNKASPTGTFVWRSVWAAPAWFAPPTTPDDELLLRTSQGLVVNEEGIGPGYRSAFGLVMLQHHRPRVLATGEVRYGDTGVRTHGTGNPRSVLEGGVSHGCHRLLPVHALRLGGFLLRHRAHGQAERVVEAWARDLRSGERVLRVERRERGTRIELTPPVPVEVTDACPGDG